METFLAICLGLIVLVALVGGIGVVVMAASVAMMAKSVADWFDRPDEDDDGEAWKRGKVRDED